MRDMNADRASMMKNRPLRKRDEDRECARALNQRNHDAQWFRDARNDGSNRDSASHPPLKLRFNLSIVATADFRSHTVTCYSKNAP